MCKATAVFCHARGTLHAASSLVRTNQWTVSLLIKFRTIHADLSPQSHPIAAGLDGTVEMAKTNVQKTWQLQRMVH